MPWRDDLPSDDAGPRLLRERLKVVAVSGDRLQLAADRAAGCTACAMRKGCGAVELAAAARPDLIEIARPDGLAVTAGDEVELLLPGGSFLAAVALAYLLPTLGVVGAAAGGLALGLPDPWVALLCLLALALALVPFGRAGRRDGLQNAFRIVAVHRAARLPGCGGT
ncbi:RseC/MucC-like positive regulator of sigma(E) [Cereibacter ovatus]|uniref:RseC/MucC-like positive regulator of sigma(E) n=1 Tax=Cereibacter ovatus TaxID=439529 RepID=A0A285CJC4_9RHOB|nr:RseC/MucC-like positive regulator of sigma(E) [Cereibacter ovatus]